MSPTPHAPAAVDAASASATGVPPSAVPSSAVPGSGVRVAYDALHAFVTGVFADRGVPEGRAVAAADALCHGDLAGFSSHGVTNLARLYLPLLDSGRCDPRAEPAVVADRGASVLLDARRALGLWAAGEAMDLAVARAHDYGVGMVSVRGATHFGCAGHHALRAVRHDMIGLATANCGRQRLVPPVGGRAPMLGTNPLALAAPAGDRPPFVLDMATTVAPTGKIRAAARNGRSVPVGWLATDEGVPVTDPGAYDRGEARLRWLGGDPHAGAYKGFGLGLLVEVLSALVPGAGRGPSLTPVQPGGPDDDIGCFLLAVAPGRLRDAGEYRGDAADLFAALLGCPPVRPDEPVGYPGCPEDARSRERRAHGVPLEPDTHRELLAVARQSGLAFPEPLAPAGPVEGSPS